MYESISLHATINTYQSDTTIVPMKIYNNEISPRSSGLVHGTEI